jgi:hypothetical protein
MFCIVIRLLFIALKFLRFSFSFLESFMYGFSINCLPIRETKETNPLQTYPQSYKCSRVIV